VDDLSKRPFRKGFEGERMSQQTLKLQGYQPKTFPEQEPDHDLVFHNKLLLEIIFGLWNQKKDELAKRGWSPQPIHQSEIFAEYKARVQRYKNMDSDLGLKEKDRFWPSYAKVHSHNWVERRVNYLATPAYGPKKEKVLMVVNVTAGKYMPNPKLFER
jgi:hypothetical protein